MGIPIDTKYGFAYIYTQANASPAQQRKPRRSLTVSAIQKYQQTALPLPATGDQTGQIARPRQENPVRLIESETLEPRERPGKQCAPRIPAADGRDTELN